MLRLAVLFLLALALPLCAQKKDPFAEGVRTSEPLSPAEQQAKFKLPQGFEIQLVAAEPDLRKPMNMAFDALGRLWVTESREYPFPKKPGEPAADSIRVFSDFGPDGRARKMEVFADGLNIPIGLYPFRTSERGWKCIAWSIPNIWLFEDTDGDGKADKREVLFGPLGWEKDTHGNFASFRRGDDGWIYGTHGFSNHSTFKARDGSTITLHSGNTYRFRIDGSRVEQWTWGQVNPFGLCWDDFGNLFSADCHSSPIYQLLRGGWYPSFGKPHDGLGFAPQTIQHSHGSTAICGPMLIRDPAWPAEFQGDILVGNVMTSRLNRDRITWCGASSKGTEMPDFLTCDDPWFRPVDLQWGPDGALYIADFYNRIIGHYEVPLTHPGRDRERGRIWRILYRGGNAAPPPLALATGADGLARELASPNPTRRSLALHELCDWAAKTAPVVPENASPLQRAALLYAQWRLGAATVAGLADEDPLVRAHALRIAGESGAAAAAARESLQHPHAIVRRIAAEALGAHPAVENIYPLLTALKAADKADDHLDYSIRAALREHLRVVSVVQQLKLSGYSRDELAALLEIMPAVPGEHAALLRLDLFTQLDVSTGELTKQLPSIIKNAPAERLGDVATLARRRMPKDGATLSAILAAHDARGVPPGEAIHAWVAALVPELLVVKAPEWLSESPGRNPWSLQERASSDGQKTMLMSSFPGGERATGVLRSAVFSAPERLRFYLCGHDGDPAQPASHKNFVRLVDAVTGAVLREAAPPRNDVAQRVEWQLADLRGKPVRFEAHDGHTASGYAWLAFGRFKPGLPELTANSGEASVRVIAASLVGRFHLVQHRKAMAELFQDRAAPLDVRAAAADALIRLGCTADERAQFAIALRNGDEPEALREQLAASLGSTGDATASALVVEALPEASANMQQRFASSLAGHATGASALLAAVEAGKATPQVLYDKATADRIRAVLKGSDLKRLQIILEKLPPASADASRLITERKAAYQGGDAARGLQVFLAQCASCHQIGKVGNLVGPQLDGIGSRGLERVLEDILDPNRNVDRAFRLTLFTLDDGSVTAGLFRREEGAQVVLTDMMGKEQTLPASRVKKRLELETSPMPAAFGQVIPPAEFNDLIAYLLAQKATQ